MLHLILLAVCAQAVRDLGSPSFEVRERAEARLHAQRVTAWRVCDGHFACPERAKRAKRVVDAHLRLKKPSPLPVLVLRHDRGWYGGGESEATFVASDESYWWEQVPAWQRAVLRHYLDRQEMSYVVDFAGVRRGYSTAACRDATQDLANDLTRWGVPRALVGRLLESK